MKSALLGACALTTLAAAAPGRAELLYRDYERLRRESPQQAERYLDGVGAAYAWANAVLESEGKPRLFCPPRGSVTGIDMYREALARVTGEDALENARAVDVPILLLKGLRVLHPCAGDPVTPGKRMRGPGAPTSL